MKQKVVAFFSLFASTGTLVCCALPAAIAALAGGAAVGAFVSNFPWIVPISQYKGWLFLIAGLLILFNGVLVLRPKGKLACSITGGKGCEVASGFSKALFWLALTLYGIGFAFAYALVPLLRFFGD